MASAIVGCGGIGNVHAEVLKRLDISLVATADINPERSNDLAKRYGAQAYCSIEEMLSDKEIDTLHICTPHYLHVPMAEYALSKNINVLMEKPPAITEEQFEKLKKAEKNSSASLGICFQNRYNIEVKAALSALTSGKTGKIRGARAFLTWGRNKEYYLNSGWRGKIATEGAGVLINQAIHTLDLICLLCGKPERVDARIAEHHLKDIIEVEDTAEAFITFEGGFNCIFYASTAYCADAPVFIEIICENAVIRLLDKNSAIIYNDGTTENIGVSHESFGKDCYGQGHLSLIKDFYENREQFPVTLGSTEDTFLLLMGILKSAKELENINLKEV